MKRTSYAFSLQNVFHESIFCISLTLLRSKLNKLKLKLTALQTSQFTSLVVTIALNSALRIRWTWGIPIDDTVSLTLPIRRVCPPENVGLPACLFVCLFARRWSFCDFDGRKAGWLDGWMGRGFGFFEDLGFFFVFLPRLAADFAVDAIFARSCE